MKKYYMQKSPFVVPALDSKLIEEDFGLASGATSKISIAHMVAPPQREEPFQISEFDEYTDVIKAKNEFIIKV